jgi:hypothetical protein
MAWYLRLLSLAAGLACIAAAAFLPVRLWHDHMPDLTPGVVYNAGPYQASQGCIQRRWREGEFMPSTCRRGHVLDGRDVGLGVDASMMHSAHTPAAFQWVRSGSDALLVGCPMSTSCRIFQVLHGRFLTSPQDSPLAEQRSDTSFTKAPAEYKIAERLPVLLAAPIGIILMCLGLLPRSAFIRTAARAPGY